MKNQIQQGTLYVVATPIGNLQDITLRAIDILKQVDMIFAEDTRITRQLLQQYAINPPKMYSCHEYNESKRTQEMVTALEAQKAVALVSDAGTPLISDPGYIVVRAVKKLGFPVIPIPGASALITALSASGLPTDRFQFEGFLPAKKKARQDKLAQLKTSTKTSVFYESTHRIMATLDDIAEVLPDHHIVIAKELTKQYERYFEGLPATVLTQFNADPLLCKGEFVILIQGNSQNLRKRESVILDEEKVLGILLKTLPVKQAVSLAVEITGGKKNELYKKALTMTQKDG